MNLREVFRRNGYVRGPSIEKRTELRRQYRKGWEVRLVLASADELERTRKLLAKAGFTPGRAFAKHSRWVQPIYGRKAFDFFTQAKELRG